MFCFDFRHAYRRVRRNGNDSAMNGKGIVSDRSTDPLALNAHIMSADEVSFGNVLSEIGCSQPIILQYIDIIILTLVRCYGKTLQIEFSTTLCSLMTRKFYSVHCW